jgi:soluble lytic murein transglycosylase-like protein
LTVKQAPEKEKVATEPLVASRAKTSEVVTDVEAIVRNAAAKYGLDPEWLMSIAVCESTLDPLAVNYNYYENGHPSGLFQHISGYYTARAEKYGYSTNVFDAYSNANTTAAMMADGLQGLWECK